MSITSTKGVRKSLIFIALVFFVSYLLVFIYSNLIDKWSRGSLTIISSIYMFIPAIVAIIVQKFIYKKPLKKPLDISFVFNTWFIVAWLFPVFLVFLTLGISLLFPGIKFSPDMAAILENSRSQISPEQIEQAKNQITAFPVHPIWITLIAGLIAGPTINAIFAFGEELGWRGFLLKELSFMGFWKSSAIIGFIWGVWHAPLILHGLNYPQHPIAGVFMMIAFCCLLSIIYNYITIKAKSVIAAAISHGTLNALPFLAVSVLKGGNDLISGVTGLAGLLAMVVTIAIIYTYDRFFANESRLLG
jgi:uncharacterized protein